MSVLNVAMLPASDRALLSAVQKLVPAGDREDWLRTWYAELWHVRHDRRHHHAELKLGLMRDALWLRTESWRNAYSGTASLCVATLATLCMMSGLIALIVIGTWHGFEHRLGTQFFPFLIGAPFVVFISFTTTPRQHVEQSFTGRKVLWLKRQAFFLAKMSLMLVLSFLLSVDICQSVHAVFPLTADLLQAFFFVLLALLGLRWSLYDQQQRCKQCLRSLTTPARVGRPSHNLLEWNGTELVCKQGHGHLSVPEIETSWCRASRWSYQKPDWDGVAGA